MKTKLCKPILVETKNESSIWSNKGRRLYFEQANFNDPDNEIRYHLHIISLDPDEKIEEGFYYYICNHYQEWYVGLYNGKSFDFINNQGNFAPLDIKVDKCRKIIASTDKSLKLPQPSPEYIQQFIEEYNKGEVKDIEVEYEDIHSIHRCCMNCGYYRWSKSFGEYLCKNKSITSYKCDQSILHWEPKDDSIFKPKIINNFITIKPVEPIVYTEEEVKQLCYAAYNDGYTIDLRLVMKI